MITAEQRGVADPAVAVLLASREPVIRHGALTQLLGRPADDPEVVAARSRIRRGPLVSGLLAGQEDDGGFGIHPYGKWGRALAARHPRRSRRPARDAGAARGVLDGP